jgi:hypothetical protein
MKKRLAALIIAQMMVLVVCAWGEMKTSVRTVAPTQASPAAHMADASIVKQGFLVTKWCADQGFFTDCRLESLVCGEGECFRHWEFGDKVKRELVLYVHNDLQYYSIKPAEGFSMGKLIEKAFAKNLVTIRGKYDKQTNSIITVKFEVSTAGEKFVAVPLPHKVEK